MSKKDAIRRLAYGTVLSLTLTAGVSAYPLVRHLVQSHTADFDKTELNILGQKMSKQSFYENIAYRNGAWRLQMEDGRVINVDSLSDFRNKDAQIYNAMKNMELKSVVDTVRARFAFGVPEGKKTVVFGMGSCDSLGYIPSMGRYVAGVLRLRHFMADNEEVQKIIDIYNDEYNCTYRHEYQHHLNTAAGIDRAGQSYETKFVECCMDEISANIAQLLEQRKHYLEHGNDISYVTARFDFYKKALQERRIRPRENFISRREAGIIAAGVFDSWMKDKYDIYIKNNARRTIKILNRTNYNGIQADPQKHTELMQKCFIIDGIDFYPYVEKRECEIRAKIPNQWQKQFLMLKKDKFQKMGCLDELEKQRIEKGNQYYNQLMANNHRLAKMRDFLNLKNNGR